MTKKLDPHPYVTADYDYSEFRITASAWRDNDWTTASRELWSFSPRAGYSQNPEDYS